LWSKILRTISFRFERRQRGHRRRPNFRRLFAFSIVGRVRRHRILLFRRFLDSDDFQVDVLAVVSHLLDSRQFLFLFFRSQFKNVSVRSFSLHFRLSLLFRDGFWSTFDVGKNVVFRFDDLEWNDFVVGRRRHFRILRFFKNGKKIFFGSSFCNGKINSLIISFFLFLLITLENAFFLLI
jgi:hypothetical protein